MSSLSGLSNTSAKIAPISLIEFGQIIEQLNLEFIQQVKDKYLYVCTNNYDFLPMTSKSFDNELKSFEYSSSEATRNTIVPQVTSPINTISFNNKRFPIKLYSRKKIENPFKCSFAQKGAYHQQDGSLHNYEHEE